MRHTASRRIATVAAMVAGIAVSTVVSAQPALAGGCEHWWEPCGEVQNYSGSGVYITLNWGSNNDDRWNSSRWLPDGQEYGGGTIDVDGFYVTARCRVQMMIIPDGGSIVHEWRFGPQWHNVSSNWTARLLNYTCE